VVSSIVWHPSQVAVFGRFPAWLLVEWRAAFRRLPLCHLRTREENGMIGQLVITGVLATLVTTAIFCLPIAAVAMVVGLMVVVETSNVIEGDD
jgi:isochorismate hydrolase